MFSLLPANVNFTSTVRYYTTPQPHPYPPRPPTRLPHHDHQPDSHTTTTNPTPTPRPPTRLSHHDHQPDSHITTPSLSTTTTILTPTPLPCPNPLRPPA
ncbi:hypothetical protein Pcinc_008953 [Petrolisthes cinctipes]|uniref:Uncharacterized protein n=1 Tax=Petrolisthes cinctipes TaxID=88211 RepID=A0AAE1KVZ2_PETCI|nr:hypothetical protein Pcinc_008953 [Petrolisthes cinctipes]